MDKHTSLQWVALLFNGFLDCSAEEKVQKYLYKKFQNTENSRKYDLWKIISDLGALYSFLRSRCH